MTNKVFRIGKFTVTQEGNNVKMRPGFLKMKGTAGNWIYCQECAVNLLDSGAAAFEYARFCKIAKQEYNIDLWERLNASKESVYLRFQRFFASKNSGKWIRGLNISGGVVSLNLE